MVANVIEHGVFIASFEIWAMNLISCSRKKETGLGNKAESCNNSPKGLSRCGNIAFLSHVYWTASDNN